MGGFQDSTPSFNTYNLDTMSFPDFFWTTHHRQCSDELCGKIVGMKSKLYATVHRSWHWHRISLSNTTKRSYLHIGQHQNQCEKCVPHQVWYGMDRQLQEQFPEMGFHQLWLGLPPDDQISREHDHQPGAIPGSRVRKEIILLMGSHWFIYIYIYRSMLYIYIMMYHVFYRSISKLRDDFYGSPAPQATTCPLSWPPHKWHILEHWKPLRKAKALYFLGGKKGWQVWHGYYLVGPWTNNTPLRNFSEIWPISFCRNPDHLEMLSIHLEGLEPKGFS